MTRPRGALFTEIGKNPFRAALPPVEHEGQPRFDARSLHAWLGAKWAFSHWIKTRIETYGFEEGADYLRISAKIKPGRGRNRTDYLLSRDMAKELAMVENNEIGRKTRQMQQSLKRCHLTN